MILIINNGVNFLTASDLGFRYFLQNGKAVIVRCYGNSPCITIPAFLGEIAVAEVASYCFSEKEPSLSQTEILQFGCDFSYAVCGHFMESVSLADGLQKIGSHAFYNCRNLKELHLPSSLQSVEGDAFMNCHALQTIYVQSDVSQPSALRQAVALIQHQVEVVFADNSRFLFPEYYEELEENTPAHIFNHQMIGVGYRYRQCFSSNRLDIAEYDNTFLSASAEESSKMLCHLALNRLLFPISLSSAAKQQYEQYLSKHLSIAFLICVELQNISALQYLLGQFSVDFACRQAAHQLAQKNGFVAAAALLAQNNAKPTEKNYDF